MKIKETSLFYEQILKLKNLAQNKVKSQKNQFEFKFSSITQSNHRYYEKLIDLYFEHKDFEFCCLVLDKEACNINIENYFPNGWDAYIAYSKLLLKKNIRQNEKICVIADYLQKPKISRKDYSREIQKLEGIFNACMLESHASLFIQAVDVLLGCVIRAYGMKTNPEKFIDQYKNQVSNSLKNKLARSSLAHHFTQQSPSYFSVWEFRPKK